MAIALRFTATLGVALLAVLLELLVVLTSPPSSGWERRQAATSFSGLYALNFTITAIASYFGGRLLTLLSTQNIFLLTAALYLPLLLFSICAFPVPPSRRPRPSLRSILSWELVVPFCYLFLSRLNPGNSDALYYYATEVMLISGPALGWVNAIQTGASVLATLFYLFCLSKRCSGFSLLMLALTLLKTTAFLLKLLLLHTNSVVIYAALQSFASFAT